MVVRISTSFLVVLQPTDEADMELVTPHSWGCDVFKEPDVPINSPSHSLLRPLAGLTTLFITVSLLVYPHSPPHRL